jgi:hypothetical protein
MRCSNCGNNLDKGSGNTLQSSSQDTGQNQKSTVSECIRPRYLSKRKGDMVFMYL